MILTAAALRLLPHPPNFTPIAALALFGGAQFSDRRAAFGVPLLALFLSDLLIGFHSLMPFVYGCFALTVLLGGWLRRGWSPHRLIGVGFMGALLFFLVTNCANWWVFDSYPRTFAGLLACYLGGLPYLLNQLAADAFYGVLLFGGFALLQRQHPMLRERIGTQACA